MWLFLLFLAVPLIEIALFIQIGGWIGLWPTLAIVVLTAVAGTALVRSQGLQVLNEVRGSFDRLSDPTEPLAHGAMVLFSGALLLTPGFFTDAVGFALLFPPVRSAVYRYVRARVRVETVTYGERRAHPGSSGQTIDGTYEEVSPSPRQGPSGWTRD
ncbi:MAG: FxsA family protein [Paracoccaceae bacterium]|nr:FxsA family protein [Paracoccaceae bacterium]